MDVLDQYVQFRDPLFLKASALIILAPLLWNVIARTEFYYKPLRKLTRSKYVTCWIIGAYVFAFSCFRDWIVHEAIAGQPKVTPHVAYDVIGAILVGIGWSATSLALIFAGQVLVLSSFYQLGFYGTFLGDYCGIYMKERVTAFPFNVVNNPMYDGSSLSFLGSALWNSSPAGVVLALLVTVVYRVALRYEGPFTTYIYSNRVKKE